MTPELQALRERAQAALQQMKFIAEGTVTRFPDAIQETPASHRTRRQPGENPRQHIGKASNRQHGESRPPRGSHSLHDFWLAKLERAFEIGGEALKLAVAEAEVAVKVARHAPEDLKSDDERSKLIIEGCVGMDPYEIAARFRCTPNHVRSLRARWDPPRDPETGEKRKPLGEDVEKREHALELAKLNFSVRRIALAVGAPKSTVQDWLSGDNGGSRAA